MGSKLVGLLLFVLVSAAMASGSHAAVSLEAYSSSAVAKTGQDGSVLYSASEGHTGSPSGASENNSVDEAPAFDSSGALGLATPEAWTTASGGAPGANGSLAIGNASLLYYGEVTGPVDQLVQVTISAGAFTQAGTKDDDPASPRSPFHQGAYGLAYVQFNIFDPSYYNLDFELKACSDTRSAHCSEVGVLGPPWGPSDIWFTETAFIPSNVEFAFSLGAQAATTGDSFASAKADPEIVIAPSYSDNFSVQLSPGVGNSSFDAVPEPGAWLLAICGLGLVGLKLREERLHLAKTLASRA